MMPPLSSTSRSDPFHLHYAEGTIRCMVEYDDLETALEAALDRLAKDQQARPWISDPTKAVLLDTRLIQSLFDTSGRNHPAPS